MASLYVHKEKYGWRVIEESYENGIRKSKTILQISYQTLGINPDWTFEQAKTRIKELNFQDKEKKKVQSSIIQAAKRFTLENELDTIYAPKDLCDQFIKQLLLNSFGSESHKKRLQSHWDYIRKMVTSLKLQPVEYSQNKEVIYKYFIGKYNSPDYTNKLLRILNSWGEFVCRSQTQFYQSIPKPRGLIRSKIEESYQDSKKLRSESDPLTPELLDSVHTLLNGYNYNWLQVTIWFGLRPNEVDLKKFRIDYHNKTPILCVYQTKLTSVSRDRRWKMIPCIYPEQLKALEFLDSDIKRPLMKTMRRVFTKQRITLYGGRKGFVDLMLDRGQSLEDISMWLGHQSIETTWRKYRNKKRISWKAG